MDFETMKKRVAMAAQDPLMRQLDDAQYGEMINLAVQDLGGAGWLLPIVEDESIIFASNIYQYDVPKDFAYIRSIRYEDDTVTPSTYDYEIPQMHWRLAYDTSRNLVINHGFEVNTSGWTIDGTGTTVTLSTAQVYYGTYSGAVVTPGTVAPEGIYHAFEGAPGVEYTVSAWIYGAAGDVVVSLYDNTTGLQSSTVETLAGAWVQVSVTATTGLQSTTFRVYVQTDPAVAAQAITFYVDGVKVQAQASVIDNAPVIVFDSRLYTFTAGDRLKVVGQKRPTEYTSDTETIQAGMESFIRERAIAYAARTLAMLPVEGHIAQAQATEGDTPSSGARLASILPGAEERRAARLMALSERCLANSEHMLSMHPAEFRVKPNSRRVPTR